MCEVESRHVGQSTIGQTWLLALAFVALGQGVSAHAGGLSVGGSVSGLSAGQSLQLRLNGGQNLSISSNGTFSFGPTLSPGSDYVVRVSSQPADRYCQVSNGNGTLAQTSVNQVAVQCAAVLANQINVLGPEAALAPGQSSEIRIQFVGSQILGGQFRLCVPGDSMTLGTPTPDPGITGLQCGTIGPGNCPGGTTTGVTCLGISPSGNNWVLPSQVRIPVQVGLGITPGNRPLLLSASPAPLLTNAQGEDLIPSAHSSDLYVRTIIPPSLGLQGPTRVSQGQSGQFSVHINGSGVQGASLRLCFDSGPLNLANAQVPPALAGLVCTQQADAACAAPNNRSVLCQGSQGTAWNTPQSVLIPFQIGINAALSSTRLQIQSGASLTVGGSAATVTAPELSVQIVADALFKSGFETPVTGMPVAIR